MLVLPSEIMQILNPFAPAFSSRIWDLVQLLLVGATRRELADTILTPGKRTVSAVLRTMGLSEEKQFQNYYRVLNRAVWSGLQVSQILLGLLVSALVASGSALIIGADETLERRQGKQIKAKGVFRDAVRSSKNYLVHSYGLRWISMMLIVPVPWSKRRWALPFLTVLAPSEATNQKNGRRHKTSIDWIMQMSRVVYRGYRQRQIILVTDGGLTAVKLGLHCRRLGIVYVSRLRLDVALYAEPLARRKGQRGPTAKKGARQPSLQARLNDPLTPWQRHEIAWYGGEQKSIEFATGSNLWYTPGFDPLPLRWVLVRDPEAKFAATAFLCTDLDADPLQILAWFILRWSLEVTFQEARAHLGVETQRQWSDLAIARTTPALFGLFSLVTLIAFSLAQLHPLPVRTSAWYRKEQPTFSDILAFVRHFLWSNLKLTASSPKTTLGLIPDAVLRSLVDTICYAN